MPCGLRTEKALARVVSGNQVRIIAGAWLVLQLAALVAAPAALSSDRVDPPSANHEHTCCPGIAPGQICPMHHTREGLRTCTMSGTCRAGDLALMSLMFALGVPVPAANAVRLVTTTDLVPLTAAARIVRAELPESPPPRA